MNILVTGGAGFIGSNFIKYMLSMYDYKIINLDLLTYAGNLNNLTEIENDLNYHFVEGDIGNEKLVREVFERFEIKIVINFAAESDVDRSISKPLQFLKTNILGTNVLLDAAKTYWKVNHLERKCKQFTGNTKFIQVSTDEVYGSLGAEGYFTEVTNIAPNNPYSVSKASSDLLARAYHETYGLPVIITRCSNNYGPNQNFEKFIPLILQKALSEKKIPIYGDGKQVRDWLYVEDHCRALDSVLHKGEVGEVYNIGGNNEFKNIEIAKLILGMLDKSEDLIDYVDDRLGHDTRYAIDSKKITEQLGWIPSHTFIEGLQKTVELYMHSNKLITK